MPARLRARRRLWSSPRRRGFLCRPFRRKGRRGRHGRACEGLIRRPKPSPSSPENRCPERPMRNRKRRRRGRPSQRGMKPNMRRLNHHHRRRNGALAQGVDPRGTLVERYLNGRASSNSARSGGRRVALASGHRRDARALSQHPDRRAAGDQPHFIDQEAAQDRTQIPRPGRRRSGHARSVRRRPRRASYRRGRRDVHDRPRADATSADMGARVDAGIAAFPVLERDRVR